MMKKIEMNAKTFRIPECSTQERLEERWNIVLKFGDKVLLAGYYYTGTGRDWFAAVYRFDSDDQSCEAPIVLRKISQDFFEDEGHAIAWAISES